jgi:peptidoglycan/LPS O-acetylase OafA/YrhL
MLLMYVVFMGMPAEAEVNSLGAEVKAVLKTAPTSRIYFVDNLKILLAVLVVLHHAAQPYGPGGGWWIASDPYNILDYVVLGVFMAVNASFFMGLFFMISAYFVPASLERKGAAKFMKDRLVKLGVPILIFVVGVFPVMGYLLNGEPSIGLGHLWFLGMLLIFSAAYAAYWLVKKPAPKVKRTFPGNAAIAAFAVVMALISFVVAIWSPENNWVPLSLFEPYHLTQYVMLFAAGIVAYREGWIDAIPKATAKLWSRVAILMVVLLLVVGAVTNSSEFSGGLRLESLLGTTWEAFMCVSMCIALLSLFKNKFNSQGPLAKALASNSFTVYLIHIPVIVFLQYLLIGVSIDSLAKFAIVGAIGVLLSFAISHYVVRRLPYAKYILG